MRSFRLEFPLLVLTLATLPMATSGAFASHEVLKCEVFSIGPAIDKTEESDLRIQALTTQRRVRDGQALLKASAADIRPKKDGVPQKLFSPDPIPSPIQYEATLIAGKSISIKAIAEVGGGEKETFDITGPDTVMENGQGPSLKLRARLKSTLEPEIRFDDKISNGFEIQCLHIPARE